MTKFFIELEQEEDISDELAYKIIETCHIREIARQVAKAALEVINGESEDIDKVQRVLLDNKLILDNDTLKPISDDLEEILVSSAENMKWRFNIPALSQAIGGIGPGSFTIVGGRPEAGKSGLWVSFSVAPDGFCWQGAKVLGLCNEEKAVRTKLRAFSAATGFTKEELIERKAKAQDIYRSMSGLLVLYDVVGLNINDIPSLIEKEKPDILVIDQLR